MKPTKTAALLLACLSFGCVTSAQPEARCLELEARYEAWGAVAAAAGTVAGGGAITTALPPDSQSRLAIGLSSAAVAALGAAAVFVAQDLLAAYGAEGCGDSLTTSSTTAEGL